jgi:hypothetical protein
MGEAWSKAAINTGKIAEVLVTSCLAPRLDMPHIACLPPGNRDPHAMAL